MIQSIRTLQTDQKSKIIIYLCLIGLSSLIIGILFNFFEVGFIFTVLCWIFTGIIELAYKQEELDGTFVIFSPQNFVITGFAGVVIILLFLMAFFLY